MKKIHFFLTLAALFVLAACNNTAPESSMDKENPVMEMQDEIKKEKAMVVKNPSVDATATANLPTAAAAKEMETEMETEMEVTAKNKAKTEQTKIINQPKTRPVQSTSKTVADKKVMPPAKVEKPQPMTTEVEQKVKVMANEVETKAVTTTSSTTTASTTTSPRPTPKAESTPAPAPEKETVMVAKPDHGLWNSLLQKNVSSSGKVNYAGIKAQKSQLEKYLGDLESNPPQSDWSRNEKLAYWINVYNAYTVKLIVDNYPVKSITNLEGGKPWDKKWINIAGKSYSLNNIENDLIRPRFKEPRIHFAVNCAAQSCPPILNKAWTADNLNRYFNQQAKAFINNSKYNQISANSATVSKIFDWYGEDFGNLIDYLNKYSDTKINSSATISFKEYDWSLNN